MCLRGEEGERAAATELSAMDGARTMAPTAGRFPSCDGKRDLRMTLEGWLEAGWLEAGFQQIFKNYR